VRGTEPGASTVKLKAREAVKDVLSSTWTEKTKLPETVGVPEITPPVEIARPGGRVPETTDHAYGATPPAAVNVAEYAAFAVPEGKIEGVEMETAVLPMVNVNDWLATWKLLSKTSIENGKVPAVEGVPEMTPVPESPRPAGKEPVVTAQL
jgi:hypothetical protein